MILVKRIFSAPSSPYFNFITIVVSSTLVIFIIFAVNIFLLVFSSYFFYGGIFHTYFEDAFLEPRVYRKQTPVPHTR